MLLSRVPTVPSSESFPDTYGSECAYDPRLAGGCRRVGGGHGRGRVVYAVGSRPRVRCDSVGQDGEISGYAAVCLSSCYSPAVHLHNPGSLSTDPARGAFQSLPGGAYGITLCNK